MAGAETVVNLLDFDLDGLSVWCEGLGEKRFRAVQLFRWIHQRGAADFDSMTDLAKSLRAKLAGGGLEPHLLMMTVAISASSSFASPLSHPAHLLVMGPGGYRFIDYMKVGVPITIISLLVSVGLLPIFWPPY